MCVVAVRRHIFSTVETRPLCLSQWFRKQVSEWNGADFMSRSFNMTWMPRSVSPGCPDSGGKEIRHNAFRVQLEVGLKIPALDGM
jgi:hypothetical protein